MKERKRFFHLGLCLYSRGGASSVSNLNGLLHSLEYGREDEDIFGLLLAGPGGHHTEVTHKPKRFEELILF
jgi:hypothetical protein